MTNVFLTKPGLIFAVITMFVIKPVTKRVLLLTLSVTLLLFAAAIASPAKKSLHNNAKQTDSITVYIFLLETCPICQSLTIEMKNLYAKFQSKGITFVGVFPNEDLSDKNSVEKFRKKYSLLFELKLDENRNLMKQFSATITPQVFVVRNTDKAVLYKGRIDNSFEGLGKRRKVVTEHYLNSALENILLNQPIKPNETQPVGCFISN